jgi:transketolase
MALDKRPNYIRLARKSTPVFTTTNTPFEIGKAYVLREGNDISLMATGTMTYHALKAAEVLSKDGISAEVVHCPTVKPLDSKTIVASAKKTGAVITAEEAQINAGFGSAVAEVLGENQPTKLKRIGMQDRFGESGDPDELLKHFGLTYTHITLAAHELVGKT